MRLTGAAVLTAWGLLAGAAEPLNTIVPLGIGAETDAVEVAASLRHAKVQAGLRRFVLHAPGHSVRLSGCYDTEGYRGVGRRVKAIQDLVRDDGIEVGYLTGPTMNAGCNLPWRPQIQKDGSPCTFRPCPGDLAFQRDFAEHCAAVAAECRPFLYVMEDDYRYYVAGCMCEDYLCRFSKASGRSWTREALVRELAEEKNVGLRIAWDDFLMEDLLRSRVVPSERSTPSVPKRASGSPCPAPCAPTAPQTLRGCSQGSIVRSAAGRGRSTATISRCKYVLRQGGK